MIPTNVVEAVRETCHKVAESSEEVHVSIEGVESFARKLLTDPYLCDRLNDCRNATMTHQPVVFEGGNVPRRLNVTFTNFDAELNFACVLGLLQTGSGYRKDLHSALGCGASDAMTLGTVAMQNALGDITAAILIAVPLSDILKWFRLDGKDTALVQFGGRLHNMLVEAGHALQDNGFASFASLVLSCKTAAELTTALCRYIPGFADSAKYHGETVWFAKKAQLTVTDIHARLVAHGGASAGYPDVESLTVFADNVLPTVLRSQGVIILSEDLKRDIDNGVLLSSGSPRENELRACAVDAAERIVKAAKIQGLQIAERTLDWLLWTVGKRPDIRVVQRHACRDTLFY